MCACGTYIKRFNQIEKFQPGSVGPANKHRNLNMNSLRAAALGGRGEHAFSF
jgi:hypothetical protein